MKKISKFFIKKNLMIGRSKLLTQNTFALKKRTQSIKAFYANCLSLIKKLNLIRKQSNIYNNNYFTAIPRKMESVLKEENKIEEKAKNYEFKSEPLLQNTNSLNNLYPNLIEESLNKVLQVEYTIQEKEWRKDKKIYNTDSQKEVWKRKEEQYSIKSNYSNNRSKDNRYCQFKHNNQYDINHRNKIYFAENELKNYEIDNTNSQKEEKFNITEGDFTVIANARKEYYNDKNNKNFNSSYLYSQKGSNKQFKKNLYYEENRKTLKHPYNQHQRNLFNKSNDYISDNFYNLNSFSYHEKNHHPANKEKVASKHEHEAKLEENNSELDLVEKTKFENVNEYDDYFLKEPEELNTEGNDTKTFTKNYKQNLNYHNNKDGEYDYNISYNEKFSCSEKNKFNPNSKKPPEKTHFINIPILDESFISEYKKFCDFIQTQKELKDFHPGLLQKPGKLHFTICVLSLGEDQAQIDKVHKILADMRSEFQTQSEGSLKFNFDGYSTMGSATDCRVVYSKIKEDDYNFEKLSEIINMIIKRFVEEGVLSKKDLSKSHINYNWKKDFYSIKVHMTLLNVLFLNKILKKNRIG